MADDGGSTGVLREEANVTPPGDVRKCLAAMAADPTDPLTRAFKYRFPFAGNHTLGNLMLSALEDAAGSFPEAIAICCHSRTALERVTLRADRSIEAYPPALEAIRKADLIVLGPGSLFTSIIPNLLVPGVVDAIRASQASTLFVCSLADMQGETWGLTAREHVEALMDHGLRGLVDYLLVHTPVPLRPDSPAAGVFGAMTGAEPEHASTSGLDDAELSGRIRPVRISYHDVQAIQAQGPVVIARNLVDSGSPTWHDPQALRDAFTAEVKDELARVPPTCSHCEKATLAALVRIEGTLFFSGQGTYRIEIATDVPSVARLIIKLLHELYHLKTELTVRRSVLHKTPNYLIEVPAQPHLADALRDMGVLSEEGGLELGIKESLVAKECCTAAYLRGAFLGSGFVSDPRGDFHFEVTVESGDLAEGLVDLLDRKGINARVMQRRSSHMVYLKSGAAILEFLAFTGAHQSALSMENARVIKSVRNDVNRMTNAEIANQAKAASASVDQIYAIREVLEAHGMENLPPALQEFIRLRVTYPDATLKELGERATPPLSKSAVYHRVRRIEQMAKELHR